MLRPRHIGRPPPATPRPPPLRRLGSCWPVPGAGRGSRAWKVWVAALEMRGDMSWERGQSPSRELPWSAWHRGAWLRGWGWSSCQDLGPGPTRWQLQGLIFQCQAPVLGISNLVQTLLVGPSPLLPTEGRRGSSDCPSLTVLTVHAYNICCYYKYLPFATFLRLLG